MVTSHVGARQCPAWVAGLRAAAGVICLLTLAACSEPANTPQGTAREAVALETALVQSVRVPRETRFDGVVEAINQSTVSAQTGGRVVELPFDVGDYVEKGDLIARFTDSEQRARVDAAASTLQEASARLAEAQLSFDRIREIYERKLVAKAQYDRAVADLDAARARETAASAALDEVRQGIEHTVIRAPYAGIVVARHVQIGETVSVGTALLTGLSLEHLRVQVEVPQQHIGALRRHREARVILPDGSSLVPVELRIPPNADPATHSFRVLLELPQGEYGLFPGTLLKVAFVSGEQERVLLPATALVRHGEIDAAYVIDEAGNIGFRYLRVGTALGDGRWPVMAGLDAGERVALDPVAAAIAYKTGSAALTVHTDE